MHNEGAAELLIRRLSAQQVFSRPSLVAASTRDTKGHAHWSYSPSSSSNSPSSSAVASWYCWYPDTRSFIFDSASVNSISSMPSPVYQCKKALRRNIAVKYSATRLNISWMAVRELAPARELD